MEREKDLPNQEEGVFDAGSSTFREEQVHRESQPPADGLSDPGSIRRTPGRRWIALGVVAVVAAFLCLTSDQEGQSEVALRSPIQHLDVPFQEATLSADLGGTITTRNGAALVIAPRSLTDKQGRIVKGDVTLKYREFKDHVDFFRAGIPMAYGRGGDFLDSVGMVELKGSQGERDLKVAPDKPLIIAFPPQGTIAEGEEDLFRLNPDGNWKQIPNARVTPEEPVAEFVPRKNLRRAFKTSGFGVWNCDGVSRLRNPYRKVVRPVDEGGNVLSIPKPMIAMSRVNSIMPCNRRNQ